MNHLKGRVILHGCCGGAAAAWLLLLVVVVRATSAAFTAGPSSWLPQLPLPESLSAF